MVKEKNFQEKTICNELAEEYKEDFFVKEGLYRFVYRDKEFDAEMSKEKLEKHIGISVQMCSDLYRIIQEKKLTSEEFPHIDGYVDQNNIITMVSLFHPGGVLCDENLLTTIDEAAAIREISTGSIGWILLYRTSFLSVVYSAAEQMILQTEQGELYSAEEDAMFGSDWDEKEWDKFFSSFICRSLISIEFQN